MGWRDQVQPGWLSSDRVAYPFRIDEDGKLALMVDGALDLTPDGALFLRTDASLEQVPGSPTTLKATTAQRALDIATSASDTAAAATIAAASAAEDADAVAAELAGKADTSHTHAQSDVTDLVADLAGKEASANKGIAGGYAPLDSDAYVPLGSLPCEIGYSELRSGEAEVTSSKFDFDSGTYEVFLTRRGLGSSPGWLYADPAERSGPTFYIRSTDSSDDAEVSWMIVRYD